ncbi:MAG: hypothetical protein JSS70_08630 [Bacteroidetes bacterium]|nr:hypothetical protein [Bacteroidota bacterium]
MNSPLQSIKIFAIAIIAGATLFGGVAIFLNKIGRVPMAPSLDPAISYAGIIIAAACIAISFLFFKKRSEAAAEANETDKLNLFRSAIIIQFALVDAPAIFNVIAYLLGGNHQSLVILACCIIVMLVQFPTDDKYNRFGE